MKELVDKNQESLNALIIDLTVALALAAAAIALSAVAISYCILRRRA